MWTLNSSYLPLQSHATNANSHLSTSSMFHTMNDFAERRLRPYCLFSGSVVEDHGVDCARRCFLTALEKSCTPRILPPLISSSSNSKGRSVGAFATRMMAAHSTIFQTRMLSIDVGLTRKNTNRVMSRATTNNARAKIPNTAIFWDRLKWRWGNIGRGRYSANVRRFNSRFTKEICNHGKHEKRSTCSLCFTEVLEAAKWRNTLRSYRINSNS